MTKVAIIAGFLLLLGLVAEPVWESREQWQFGPFRDDGIYLAAAKSLAAGEGYREQSLPGHPYLTKYPPLYPLYLSLAWRIQPGFPRVLETASVLQALLLAVYLALQLALLRQLGLSWRRALFVGALTIVSFSLIMLTITLYSELLFGCFLAGAIWSSERSVRAPEESIRCALAGGLFTGLAYLTRSAALPMLAAVPIFFFLRKRFRLSAYFFAAALPIAAVWQAWASLNASGVRTPYLDEYVKVIRTDGLGPHLMNQVALLSTSVAEELLPGITEFLRGIPLHHLVFAAAISGGIRMGRKQQWPLWLIFTGLYLAMIACWWGGARHSGRFIVPVWAALVAGIVEEGSHFASLCAQSIKSRSFQNAPRWALIAVGLCLIVRNDRTTLETVRLKVGVEREERQKDLPAYRWIAEHAGRDTVVLTSKDTLNYFYTGVPSSREMLVTLVPQLGEVNSSGESLASLPPQFTSALVAFFPSDFADFSDRGMAPFRAPVASVPGSRLEYSGPSGVIYRFPIVR